MFRHVCCAATSTFGHRSLLHWLKKYEALHFFLLAMAYAGADGLSQDTRGSGESDANRTRGRGGREYVTNAALGLKRPPAAFQLFLAAQRGTLGKLTRHRIAKKQTYFRLLKYDSVPSEERQPYVEQVAVAKARAEGQRCKALQQLASGDGSCTRGCEEKVVAQSEPAKSLAEPMPLVDEGMSVAGELSVACASRGFSPPPGGRCQ